MDKEKTLSKEDYLVSLVENLIIEEMKKTPLEPGTEGVLSLDSLNYISKDGEILKEKDPEVGVLYKETLDNLRKRAQEIYEKVTDKLVEMKASMEEGKPSKEMSDNYDMLSKNLTTVSVEDFIQDCYSVFSDKLSLVFYPKEGDPQNISSKRKYTTSKGNTSRGSSLMNLLTNEAVASASVSSLGVDLSKEDKIFPVEDNEQDIKEDTQEDTQEEDNSLSPLEGFIEALSNVLLKYPKGSKESVVLKAWIERARGGNSASDRELVDLTGYTDVSDEGFLNLISNLQKEVIAKLDER